MKLIKSCIYAIIILSIFSVTSCGKFAQMKKDLDAMQIVTPDLSKVADGEYEGYVDLTFVTAKVNVKMQEGKIDSIDLLEHKHGPSAKYNASGIIQKVIDNQSLEVDSVTGATGSSKAIRKAVQLAIEKGVGTE